ncbi:NAD(P)+ transhydrogenase beta chain [Rhizobium sp. YJ-22]|uniref:NAD(P)+ transhydrogenase beta chain n=1 Tax=Rhizobium sp. YJ-22 TaxID=3037556 RepID=UPI0024129207|nr:NAD(P)+ transhydrogenase beta chain [Rhizobium sp. YJ-22]MDG3580399.1 NAD(P)+ transhydrogenase beta chain [Rhizobium sp. YJ-22]
MQTIARMIPHKPGYTTTRQMLWISFGSSWAINFAVVIGALLRVPQAIELAQITFPTMVLLIASLLGIHRGFGSLDYRAAAAQPLLPGAPPYDARDDPPGEPQ